MRYSTAAALLLAPAALAQSSSMSMASASASASASGTSSNSSSSGASAQYLQQVLGALTAANLTGLVGVASAIANTTEGMELLSQLAVGNKTVFAPNNEAFAAVPESVSSNTTLLTQILSYHILNNTYSGAGIATEPNHTIARTLLRGGVYQLPGNRTAPLVLQRSNMTSGSNSSSSSNSSMSSNSTSFEIVQANITQPMGPASAANLEVYIIDTVLDLPANLTTVATQQVPSVAGLIQQAGLLTPLEQAVGITVFAPNDAAVAAAQSALGSITNATVIQNVLLNHVINGTAVYSTMLGSGNYTSAGGEPFKFMTNSSGSYVMSGNSTAMIVKSDIIIDNGVVHTIDGILLNTGSDASAASSAYMSNTQAAATAAEPTGAITATSQPATSNSGGSSSSTGAGGRVAPFGITGSMIGGAFGVVAAVLGGAFVLV